MSNILKSCLVSISLVAIFTNNGYTSTNQPLSNINSNITIEKLKEYTQLFRQMRKYKAQLEGKKDSNQVISVDDALKKYHVLSTIITLANLMNYNNIASDASKIIDNIYNTIFDYEKGTRIVSPVFKLLADPSDDQIDIKTLPQEQFLVNFNKYFKQIVSTLLREQCAFISDYSPSNTKNTDVVNLFIIAWHVVIKYAQDNGYPEIETMLMKFFNATQTTGILINSDWIGISSNSTLHNNNMNSNQNNFSNFNNNNVVQSNNFSNNIPMNNSMNNINNNMNMNMGMDMNMNRDMNMNLNMGMHNNMNSNFNNDMSNFSNSNNNMQNFSNTNNNMINNFNNNMMGNNNISTSNMQMNMMANNLQSNNNQNNNMINNNINSNSNMKINNTPLVNNKINFTNIKNASISMDVKQLWNFINTNNQQHQTANDVKSTILAELETYSAWRPRFQTQLLPSLDLLLQENIEFINNWDYMHNKETYKKFSQAWDKVLNYLKECGDMNYSKISRLNEKLLYYYNSGQFEQ